MQTFVDFEDYLMQQHMDEENPSDDEGPDMFNAWLVNLDAEEWLDYGQRYADSILPEKKKETISL